MGFFSERGEYLLKKQAEIKTENIVRKYNQACGEATDEIRKELVIEWFGKYSYKDVVGAFNEVHPYNKHQSKSNCVDSVIITTHTYVDLGKYAPRPSAERWLKKHDGVPSPEWVLGHLQMDEGIIGLPYWESKTWDSRTNSWNIKPHKPIRKAISLRQWILGHPKWNDFINRVKSKV